MSEEAEISRKVGRAFQMLVLQKHRYPGVKGWELKKTLGKDYPKYIEILNEEISKLGLSVKTVFEDAGEGKLESEQERMERARYFVVFGTSSISGSDAGTLGLRIDDIAVLAASLAYMIPRQGKARRREVEQVLREKFPKWKVQLNLDRFIRRGYLLETDDDDHVDMLQIGWRTKAEIDQKTLLNLILAEGAQ
ncbi:MAG: hypothetical protein ACE5JV_01290 [Nitrososphaerales archaeon]